MPLCLTCDPVPAVPEPVVKCLPSCVQAGARWPARVCATWGRGTGKQWPTAPSSRGPRPGRGPAAFPGPAGPCQASPRGRGPSEAATSETPSARSKVSTSPEFGQHLSLPQRGLRLALCPESPAGTGGEGTTHALPRDKSGRPYGEGPPRPPTRGAGHATQITGGPLSAETGPSEVAELAHNGSGAFE